jgi:hypothetical protein
MSVQRRSLLLAGLVAACQIPPPGPVLSRADALALSPEWRAALLADTPLYQNPSAAAALAEIAPAALLLDDPQPRLWALPDGTIGVARGLVRLADTEEALLAALAHGAAHIRLDHLVRSGASPSTALAMLTRGYPPALEAEAEAQAIADLRARTLDPARAAGLQRSLAAWAGAPNCLFAGASDAASRLQRYGSAATLPPRPASPAFQALKRAFPTPRAIQSGILAD